MKEERNLHMHLCVGVCVGVCVLVFASPVLATNVDRRSLIIILAFLKELSSFRELL